MMKKTCMLLLAAATMLAFGSCKTEKRPAAIEDDEEDTELADDEYDDESDDEDAPDAYVPERKDFTFKTEVKVTEEDGSRYASDIIVHIIQGDGYEIVANCEPEPLDPDQWHGFGNVTEEDINFDGWPDLQVCLGPTNGYGNFRYEAWVWNQKRHMFVNVDGYNEIFDPELHPTEKTITGCFRMDDHEDQEVYEWENGKLVKVGEETIVYSELEDE